jgi:hypothetical protein
MQEQQKSKADLSLRRQSVTILLSLTVVTIAVFAMDGQGIRLSSTHLL